MYETILLEKSEGIYTLTFNQPHNLNALSFRLAAEFQRAIQEIGQDGDARFLILTGAGESFSSGGDFDTIIAEFSLPAVELQPRLRQFYPKFLGLRDLPVPTLAAVNGHAVGAGFSLALACDLRVASTRARFFPNFVRIGVHPGMGASYLLPRLVGTAKALEILWLADPLSAEEAFSLGLVNRLAEPQELLTVAMDLARRISSRPRIPVRLTKQSVYMAPDANLKEMLEYESFAQALCAESEDMKRAIAAFHAKGDKAIV
jgi:2-(1,2-epoxy-1,2-dihydrophenyl)acetyl-CoA isomerase